MPDLKKIEDVLSDVNNIVGRLNPLIGVISGLAELVIHTARKTGVDPAVFEATWKEYQSSRAELAAALDDFHKKYPPAEHGPVNT